MSKYSKGDRVMIPAEVTRNSLGAGNAPMVHVELASGQLVSVHELLVSPAVEQQDDSRPKSNLWTALNDAEDDTLWAAGLDPERPVSIIRQCDVPDVAWDLIVEAVVARQSAAQSQGVEAWGVKMVDGKTALFASEIEADRFHRVCNDALKVVPGRFVPVDDTKPEPAGSGFKETAENLNPDECQHCGDERSHPQLLPVDEPKVRTVSGQLRVPESMLGPVSFDDSTDEELTPVKMVPVDEPGEPEDTVDTWDVWALRDRQGDLDISNLEYTDKHIDYSWVKGTLSFPKPALATPDLEKTIRDILPASAEFAASQIAAAVREHFEGTGK